MGNTLNFKIFFLLIASLLCSIISPAQREKNYIYLFDCTGSMNTNKLWEPAKSALENNITLRASIPGSNFTVIPFGNNAYDSFSFDNSEFQGKRNAIFNAFEKYIKQAKFTNISDVLQSGFRKVDPNKENEIYLFTDGQPNGTDSSQKVAQTINEWCARHRNAKLFYVALTDGVINPVIKQAIDNCADASIVQCENGIVPVISDISTDVYTNLEELDKPIELGFSIPGDYSLRSACSDELFGLSIVGNKASKGKIKLKVSPKGNLSIDELHQSLQGEEYVFPATIQCAEPNFAIANPTVMVHVLDKVPSKLTLAEGVDELQTTGVKWYDSFLWSDAAPDHKTGWDLSPVFKNELHGSYLDLQFRSGEGQPDDFLAWYNGKRIGNGSKITVMPGHPAILEVQFNHDAVTGKRYFSLIPVSSPGIDIINDRAAEDYTGTSLRTEYNVVWNPLKTLLFCLAIVLLAILILWFAILRRIFFPPIKMGKVLLTGPDTYYATKTIKGARKVILTSKRRSQNIFSRIFTGEIKFVKAEHFSPEISIVPAGGKKKVKLRSEGIKNNNWDLYPTSIFGQFDKGVLTNRTTNEKTEIEFS